MMKTFLLLYYVSNDDHLLPCWTGRIFFDKTAF